MSISENYNMPELIQTIKNISATEIECNEVESVMAQLEKDYQKYAEAIINSPINQEIRRALE